MVIVVVPVGFVLAWWSYGLLRERDLDVAPRAWTGVVATSPRERGSSGRFRSRSHSSCVELLLLLPSELQYLRELHTPFVVLEAAGFVAVVVASLVIPGFAFAACSDELAGKSGLRKGLNVGIWVIACSLPAWFLRVG